MYVWEKMALMCNESYNEEEYLIKWEHSFNDNVFL